MATEQTREIELKYAVDDPTALRALLEAEIVGGLKAGPWRVVALNDRYVDTASRSLERAGYGARLRHAKRRTTLTVKSVRNGSDHDRDNADHGKKRAARHDRMELEGRANQHLDPLRWPESAARSVVETAAAGERLRTLFTINQRRNERDLCREDGSVLATLSLDEAEVSRFGRALGSFTVLEVEMSTDSDEASEALLDDVADELEASGLVRPEAS